MYLWEWVVEMECMEPAQDNVRWHPVVLVVLNISVLLLQSQSAVITTYYNYYYYNHHYNYYHRPSVGIS